ncbi:double-stranded RNA-specific editase Adar [Anabrus simplex]|uniref:double-stranded RNA-specific editase Adar n=1 Tax=Anabrus simplex TaxID=316456 RepID=UPI0035A3AAD3
MDAKSGLDKKAEKSNNEVLKKTDESEEVPVNMEGKSSLENRTEKSSNEMIKPGQNDATSMEIDGDIRQEKMGDISNHGDNRKLGQKRSLPMDIFDATSPAKKKRKKSPAQSQPKNAVCALNELRPGLVYTTVGQTGPVHAPTFTVSVEVNGQVFEGQGRSKKLAKHAAAEAALRSFVQFKNAPEAQQAMNMHISDLDFTSDVTETEASLFNAFQPAGGSGGDNSATKVSSGVVQNGSGLVGTNAAILAASRRSTPRMPIFPGDKSPVMLLNELRPGIKYECVSETGEPYAKFTMSVTIDGETFEGTGPSKKLGKAAAAKAALAKLYNVTFTPFSSPMQPNRSMNSPGTPTVTFEQLALPQVLADHIARLVINKFTSLMEGHPSHSRRKVLAGLVMTTGPQMEDAKVISVTTGTKCINGEHMSVTGSSLNDTHAEIIARRCLVDFLYSQLEMHITEESAEQSIFIKVPEKNGYQLKENVKFHLYISTAPCGDARIFSPHEAESQDDSIDKHPNRKARGQLRTKIESGEGTIPVKSSDGIQTWDGVLQGQRLLTMSCSDKIARWNVVGVQGALLSHFVEPIYLESIVLGSLFHPSHMYRAVCGRIENTIQGLPPPYRMNKPLMSLITSPEVRQPGKAPNYSVNWTTGLEGPEIINSVTGKDERGNPSRLSKRGLFGRFLNLVGRISSLTGLTFGSCPRQYSEAKAAVQDYNMAKEQLVQAFHKAELGMWLKKPIEQDQFELDGNDSNNIPMTDARQSVQQQ